MNEYPDKFHLSPEQSIFIAKKKWDENIYCGMRMENRAVTFPQTKTRMYSLMIYRLFSICGTHGDIC